MTKLRDYLYIAGGIVFIVFGAKLVILAGLAYMMVLAVLGIPGAIVRLVSYLGDCIDRHNESQRKRTFIPAGTAAPATTGDKL